MALSGADIQNTIHSDPVEITLNRNDKVSHSRIELVTFKCPKCKRYFSPAGALLSHFNQKHHAKTRFVATIKQKSAVKTRTTEDKPNKIKTEKFTIQKKYVCEECGKIFDCASSKRTHRFRNHRKQASICHICNKTFKEPHSLKIHLVSHSDSGMVNCDVCDKSVNKFLLKRHLRSHEEKRHECISCDKTFPLRYLLDAHIAKRHSESVNIPRTPYSVQCDICERVLSNHAQLELHMSRKHTGKKFICHFCERGFLLLKFLEVHIKKMHMEEVADEAHEQPCRVCGKEFSCKKDMKSHMLSHSKIEKTTCCFVCGKLVIKSAFHQHLLIHSEKKFQCTTCGKKFAQNTGLTQHQKSHNRIKQKYPCHICGKLLSSATWLKGHIKNHDKRNGATMEEEMTNQGSVA